jgi:uncharacterized protein YqjF (DUF2071 family)
MPANPLSHDIEIDRIAPTFRPAERLIGYQVWSHLLFVHWRIPAEQVRPLIPPELSVDTWDGDAWVGLVPFDMSGVRPWWSPAVPSVSNFLETNVRTYVHFRGRDPGVCFFSLEASSSLAVRVARWRWHLPYYKAVMELDRRSDAIDYHSRRLWPGPAGSGCVVRAEIGPLLGHADPGRPLPAGRAIPGTFEHFLVERYILYAANAQGRLYSGHVYHTPYPVREARLLEFIDTLLPAAGVYPTAPPEHVAFSDGVSVEIFPLRPVAAL